MSLRRPGVSHAASWPFVLVVGLSACGGGNKNERQAAPAAAPVAATRAGGVARGTELERSGDLDGALQAYRAAYEAEPEAPGNAHQLARLLARRGDLRSARSLADAGLVRRPDDVELLVLKAVLARLDGDLDGALQSAKAALMRSPYEPGATLELARAFTKQKKTALATAMLTRAVEAAPNDARLHFGLAEVARATGDDTRALVELTAAAARDPNEVAVQVAIGSLALAHRDYGRAKAAYERAVALGDTSQPTAQGLQLAAAQVAQGSKEKAQ